MRVTAEPTTQPDTTRARLLYATWEIIREHGVRAATSRRITTEAGANLGSITYHFGSKSRLVAEAGAEQMRAWTAPLETALLEDEVNGQDRTNRVIASLLSMLEAGGTEARALLEVLLSPDIDPEVAQTVRHHLGEFQQTVASLMRGHQQNGEIPRTVDPVAMSGLFTAFALGLLAQQAIEANPAPVTDIVGQLLALLAR